MTNINSKINEANDYLGSVSISYDYEAGYVGIALQSQNERQKIAEIDVEIDIKPISTSPEKKRLRTDSQGRAGFNYDLTNVATIDVKTLLVTPAGEEVNVAHGVNVVPAGHIDEPLTISGYLEEEYFIIFGQLSSFMGEDIGGVNITLFARNYDIDGDIITLNSLTDPQGKYSAKILLREGDWDMCAQAPMGGELYRSRDMNVVLRREEQKFVGLVKAADALPHYTGFAAYPSLNPSPMGEFA